MLGYPGTLPVTSQVSGGCESGSDSVGNVEVYRCAAGNYIYDPCWGDSAGGVLCMESPWATSVVHLAAQGVPPGVDVTSPDLDLPWGVELASGARCLALQGAHDSFANSVVEFSCTEGPLTGLALLRGVDRSTPFWSYRTVIYNGSSQTAGSRVDVATAWFAGPAPITAPYCHGKLLAVTASVSLPSAGMAWLIFENLSSSACRLHGYPGVGVLEVSGNKTSQISRTPIGQGPAPTDVVIPEGGAASAVLNGDPHYPNESCPGHDEILVTPPNTTATMRVKVGSLVICSDAQIDPVGVGGKPVPG
jgi:hypothetical protein